MKSFLEFMEKYFVPVAGRIGSQRHLVAVRDGFVSIMPLILAGSVAVLLNNTLFSWIPALGALTGINGNVWWGTFAIMTLVVVFSIGYNLAKSYSVDGLAAGLVAVASFITVTPQAHGEAGWGYIHWGYLNATGLFTGIIVALISTEIFVKLMKKKLTIKMPDNVPPAVGRAFAAVIPGIAALYLFAIVGHIITTVGANSLYDIIYNAIQQPLQGFSQGLGSAIILAVLLNVFWFFGLHGGNIFDPIINALYLPALEANASAVQQGLAASNIVTKAFYDSFVHIGGCGATLALIVAIYIAARKRNEYREVAKLSAPAGLFNINEPMMFGLPLILNPILLIPFILTPGILTFVAYIATASGLVPMTYVQIPWITPVGISGFLATGGSIMGGLLSVVNFVIAILIYLPFIKLADNMANEPGTSSHKAGTKSADQSA
ncbi:MAG TPA: PTS sugar transporter subunit IIC [Clostridia bacterium]|nr:PTS sugar transporter subunit IIC [Clostridia bacterium]